ncbi:hypothetical protein [Mesorhizobium opportunistum]|uniref:Uncharacterized protein n=1 Tax=Mesorhizobium opportunistum (strain LMG 24607 / HAMBI 3007 / WSM2075) TaxID=536019 RepID=F7Y109_MESOW|nr:hypothetical protein [Mesorhizobium opportunistum]AEH88222.1 hypothetical protein Mesop_3781 [Mesorhizobium opportunistum WSM2075]
MGQWGDSEIKIGRARFLRHYTTKDCWGPIQSGAPCTYVMIDDGGDPVAAEAALAQLEAGGSGMDWMPPETAPKDGSVFEITTAGPQQDLSFWHEQDGVFRDYYHKQAIPNKWPYMVAWRPLRPPAEVGNSVEESRMKNGWKVPAGT